MSETSPTPQKRQLTRQQKFMRRVVLPLTVVTSAVGIDAVGHSAYREGARIVADVKAGDLTHDPKPTFPKGTKFVSVTINQPSEGAQEVIEQVEPQLSDAGWSPEEQKVEDYITAQGLASGPSLELGQSVNVPIVVQPPYKK